MKNINLLTIIFSLVFFSFGCQKEYVEPKPTNNVIDADLPAKSVDNTCTNYFYYYNQQKVSLGNVSAKKVIIGLPDGYTTEQKTNFIAKFNFLSGISSESNSGSADATVVLLKEGYSCSQVEAGLEYLKQFSEVRYATPVFGAGDSDKGITNQFIVNLKASANRVELESIAKKTNTTIVDQLSEVTFILSADKTSQGNALEMANYFNQNSRVDSSEPDFLFLFNSSYVIND